MKDVFLAIGLVLAVEGFLYAAFPGFLKVAMNVALGTPEQVLRLAGLAVLAAGVFFVWLARG